LKRIKLTTILCISYDFISRIETTTVGIYVLKFHDGSQDIVIVLEGQNVLQGLDNFALATAMLFGLMYALNLNYPPEMKYTFEVLQKEVMESLKLQRLKSQQLNHTEMLHSILLYHMMNQ
uniref:Uncharacterized protein n=1 Tax=Sinocyclocheilus anshuiensis TaxID=1608454 RepID=A0A671K1F7_9TELE